MKEYKVVITDDETEVNEILKYGWSVESVTAQKSTAGGNVNGFYRGTFCFVLKK